MQLGSLTDNANFGEISDTKHTFTKSHCVQCSDRGKPLSKFVGVSQQSVCPSRSGVR